MAHGVADVLTATDEENCVKMVTKQQQQQQQHTSVRKTVGVMGSRRIFAPAFKLKVLDSYRNDIDCRGNQRATARKYGIHRRQIQKWLQCEDNLRSSCVDAGNTGRAHNHSSASPSSSSPSSTTSSPSSIGNSAVSGAPIVEGPHEQLAAPAPALNLSRARLHGDEKLLSFTQSQQGSPLRQHCPASPRYGSPRTLPPQNGQNSMTLSPIHPETTGLASETQQRQHFVTNTSTDFLSGSRPETTINHMDSTLHRYGSRSEDRSSYYATKSSYEMDSVLYEDGVSADVKLYHQASSRYCNNGSPVEHYSHNFRDENFSGVSIRQQDIAGQISPGAVAIKNEPASLDAAAAPGPSDLQEQTNGRPSSRLVVSPPLPPRRFLTPHHATTAVHSELSRTSPNLIRTQPKNDDGGCGGAVTAGVAAASAAKANENSGNAHNDGNTASSLRQAVARPPHVYPEPHSHIQSSHTHQQLQPQHHLTQTHLHALGDGEYSDRIEPPASVCSAPAQCVSSLGGSPPLERVFYSGPPSPVARSLPSPESNSRGPLSSGHSTTSSDSETDALDYSTTTLTPSNDLARRRSFSLRFKLDVLDAFHRDAGVAGNQRATARKFGINRRQVQKWLSQETELRGEIALRGGVSRQRLGPLASTDSPIDLRTNNPIHNDPPEISARISPREHLTTDSYCCYSPDTAVSPHPQRQPYFLSAETSDVLSNANSLRRGCTLSCCADKVPCYSQESLRISESTVCSYNKIQSCYASESHSVFACFSSHDSTDISIAKRECNVSCYDSENIERITTTIGSSSPLKRSCTLSCCSYATSSPKKLRTNHIEEDTTSAPQDAPLCLVKPKGITELAAQVEPVTSTVPTPPAPPALLSVPISVASTKRDTILFKPYLDNPIAKPTDDQLISNDSSHHNYSNINNNCQSVCNLNSNNGGAGNRSSEGYALELSLRVPISWGTPARDIYSDISQVGSAFVRYPTTQHYT